MKGRLFNGSFNSSLTGLTARVVENYNPTQEAYLPILASPLKLRIHFRASSPVKPEHSEIIQHLVPWRGKHRNHDI